MKALQPLVFVKNKTNSFFIRLISGFLCIIVLLVSFNFFSMSVSRDNVREEIVKYNNLNLKNTMESYEKHFELIKKVMLAFTFNSDIEQFLKNPKYIKFPAVQKEIQKIVSNELLFLDNIVLHMKSDSQIIDKSTSAAAEVMFSTFYKSDDYTQQFWTQQFNESYTFKINPASSFVDLTFPNAPAPKGVLFPVILKTGMQNDSYTVALLDASKMLHAFHNSINENLLIMDGRGQSLFANASVTRFGQLPVFADSRKSLIVQNGYYYFYMKGPSTGFTYVNIVPVESISSQMKMGVALISLLVVSIAISMGTAVFFVMRVNNPLKKVVESIQHLNAPGPVRSQIKEFDMIGLHLHQKNSSLKNYAYIDRLKKIRSQLHDSKEYFFSNRPFVFILFDLTYRDRSDRTQETESNWAYYIREFVDFNLSQHFRDTLTFQIEKKQILSYVFLDRVQVQELMEVLYQLKTIFDRDKNFGFITITVSSQYKHSSELTKAYEETLHLLQERCLTDETQIIGQRRGSGAEAGFSPDEEREFDVHLREGNAAAVIRLVRHTLARMTKKEVSAVQALRFAGLVTDKAMRTLASLKVDTDQLSAPVPPAEQIERCYTFLELESYLERIVTQASELIKGKKESKDAITSYVFDYVENHYAEEIYLDVLAEKLNISGGYLSTSFKEKTGMNFVDYVNEVRVRKAQRMLAEPGFKIQDVAKKVGYQNINSFNRMFKKFSGLTPSEFRKKQLLASYDDRKPC
ncbi:hypothetical protein SD70_04715 [Gordoniibacillus kamchatkensis]|uniref:HTH araC/xylS-type domain-containing protein n=1 Tax=Gordoniibacillus kamchatkensis TaxID=1590651 RepID=A0ABR5AM08_9BACL|nr:helix-turn-helix domain-containing protein [Paenibacillus sp. VKM B-2647]KIL41903.1 hypothetical protein SD70_04715 [Paenibacillus sp. VKM B-2647]